MSGWQSASSEQSCRNRSSLAELCSGPIPSYLIQTQSHAMELVILVEVYIQVTKLHLRLIMDKLMAFAWIQ